MKKSCKNIDITDIKIIYPFVQDCCYRHYRRRDFKHLFIEYGHMTLQEYNLCLERHDRSMLKDAIFYICRECVRQIQNKKLELLPITIRIKYDPTSGKTREIGKESALQQCLDYIAVYSCMDIFRRRMVREQASSIDNRGQVYGMKIIKKWVKKDYKTSLYAKKHNIPYNRKCAYFVKLDIKKCYPSANMEIFLNLFEKDCGNNDILWLWKTLLETHKVNNYQGFMIGSLPSQWACQYMLSFIYRYAKSLNHIRRNIKYKDIEHMLMFMDDMLLTSISRSKLKSAVKKVITYTKKFLGWTIKPNWFIQPLNRMHSIDMMGYVIRYDGTVEVRNRNFIRTRRLALRFTDKLFTIGQAKRILSFKGFFKYSDAKLAVGKYSLDWCFASARGTVSRWERKRNGYY